MSLSPEDAAPWSSSRSSPPLQPRQPSTLVSIWPTLASHISSLIQLLLRLFYPIRLCVYQTDSILSANQESRSQFLFHVYGLRASIYKWTMSRPYIKIELQQPAQDTNPLFMVTSPGHQPAICKTDS